jgi:hypothetical protein
MTAQRTGTVPKKMRSAWRHARHVAHREARAYGPGEGRSLAPYAGALVTYGGSVGLIVAAGAAAGVRLPRTVPAWDVALLGVATHKLSRLVAKDTVTAPLRAPFTELRGSSGAGELTEEVRDDGTRHMLGELLTCPFCLAQWIATGFTAGLVFAPRVTRLVATTFTVVAVSDMLQNVYALLQQKDTGQGAYQPRPVELQVHTTPDGNGGADSPPARQPRTAPESKA